MMKIIITEEQKKNLFIPRNLEKREVEFEKMVKDGNDKFLIDNDIKSLKYVIKASQIWDNLDYADIENAIRYEGEIIFIDGEYLDIKRLLYYKVNHNDLIDYSHTISGYLSYLITQRNPKDLVVNDLEIEVDSVVDKIELGFNFVVVSYDSMKMVSKRDVINFSKTL